MFEHLIIIFMGIVFLIILPIMSTIKYWNYKPYMKYALSLIWISYIVIAYEVFFPRESYYIKNLNKFSNITFSKEIKIIDKYTSFLNIEGEYSSCAIFEIPAKDKVLLSKLKEDKTTTLPNMNNKCSNMINKEFKNNNLVTFKSIDEKNYRQWGFLKNSNKVFFYYKSFGMTNK
ncbi:hypothetical protein Arnit_1820 [Arcobacter nitrofigilis DSM 7299]|uniref:Uncharacterized protein n=1 Tax=Arcobacter nitrofigilis (strain ATCC 33309 / DSM 7299 / CCUG 15893 / LMG 7604 / NCTC 12251 / CI) TaxID=572480 RepID=D5V1P0_ARCNC|nr:hypothetical protein [Arcobacter nitrofigilis]ADG93474.1 hypothetical protein Arnit_1820 [Arcobacter nitrofigilis DSM 7299]